VPHQAQELLELARLYNIQASYHDVSGRLVEAAPESLLAALAALNAPVESMGDVGEALAARREELAQRLLEPVVVAWEGRPPAIELRLRPGEDTLACHLDLEGGERRAWTVEAASLPAAEGGAVRRLVLSEPLALGYHRLTVRAGGRTAAAQILAAPERAFGAMGGERGEGGGIGGMGGIGGRGERQWGLFAPLYAFHTARSWGAGDLTDLETLAAWTAELGGGVVATLPLLAAFLDEPCEPSPYAPASRLFWNELYLDLERLPEAAASGAARRLLDAPEIHAEIAALRAAPLVDYPRLAILKRRVMEEMAAWFWSHATPRRDELEGYLGAHPELATYAAFRAVGDRRGEPWQAWPERLRDGTLAPADYDDEDFRYHLWAQWAAARQMLAAAGEARRRGPGLYLDLPVGVHGGAYDVWRRRDLFAEGAAAGAPPDAFFTQGQNWGFPPLQPERLRERGYDYWIACLRHHLEQAEMLRIDHVMQLHRLFWIPRGLPASQGVYVRYPSEELYAVLALESHRHRAVIVGENLGTVPPEVNEAMERHGVLGMYVLQYELAPGGGGLQREPPARSVASLNTHDMPTFRGFWRGRDVADLQALGFFDAAQAHEEGMRRQRQREQLEAMVPEELRAPGDPYPAVLRTRLEHLAASAARLVLVNLEDLLGEEEPQNVPGTHAERPNWRRKARLSFEELARRPDVVWMLRRVDELRRGGKG
jgi:4-alpha-glucanotransferase